MDISWDTISKIIREVAKETLGETSGKVKENREIWWWDKEVQKAIASKTEKKKGRDLNRSEETVREYKEACKIAKREVAKAKSRAYKDLDGSLDSSDGLRKVMRMAKIKNRNLAEVLQAKLIKNREGRTLVDDGDISKRWGEYFAVLLNMENERMERSVEPIADTGIEPIAREENPEKL